METIFDAHGNPIDPLWAAEFRGFFLGDGSLQIQRYRRSRFRVRGKLYKANWQGLRPVVSIVQRRDDRAILDMIAQSLGGHVCNGNSHKALSVSTGKTYITHPTAQWTITSTRGVRRVLSLLKDGALPHSKLREIKVMERYLDIRPTPGHKLTPSVRTEMWSLFEEIKRVRQYHE